MIPIDLVGYIAILAVIIATGFAYFRVYNRAKAVSKPLPLFDPIFLVTAGIAYLLAVILIRIVVIPLATPLSDPEGFMIAFILPLFLNIVFNRILYVTKTS